MVAEMSSVYSSSDYQPALCVDGVTANPSPSDLNICLSALNRPNTYLSATLAAPSVVSEVVIYGRSDCCNTRFLSNFQVWLSDAVGATGTASGAYLCGGVEEVLEDRASVNTISCGGRMGRVVTLLLLGSARTMMISELVVRGYAI